MALHYVSCKAGMNENDKERLTKIITEASKDSDYYKREQLRSQTATDRAFQMKKRIEEFQNTNGGRMYSNAEKEVKNIITLLE